MIEAQKKMMKQRDDLDELLEERSMAKVYKVMSQNALDLLKSSIERNKMMNGLSKAIGK